VQLPIIAVVAEQQSAKVRAAPAGFAPSDDMLPALGRLAGSPVPPFRFASSVEEKQIYEGGALPAKAAVDASQEQVAQAEINLMSPELSYVTPLPRSI